MATGAHTSFLLRPCQFPGFRSSVSPDMSGKFPLYASVRTWRVLHASVRLVRWLQERSRPRPTQHERHLKMARREIRSLKIRHVRPSQKITIRIGQKRTTPVPAR